MCSRRELSLSAHVGFAAVLSASLAPAQRPRHGNTSWKPVMETRHGNTSWKHDELEPGQSTRTGGGRPSDVHFRARRSALRACAHGEPHEALLIRVAYPSRLSASLIRGAKFSRSSGALPRTAFAQRISGLCPSAPPRSAFAQAPPRAQRLWVYARLGLSCFGFFGQRPHTLLSLLRFT